MVHGSIVDLFLQQDATLLGLDAAHLGKALSSLAEVHRNGETSSKEIDDKIVRVFQLMPQNKLMEISSSFSEKQQKKIEKMLASPPVVQHGG